MKTMEPIHPGQILKTEFLSPAGLTEKSFAEAIGASEDAVHQLVIGKVGITASLALRFAGYFGNSAEFWMNLQTHYDLEIERDRAHI